ncbi:hypothetical protein GW830_03460 [bacterium]|nr:hypothetical protein [bacterium]
MELLIVVTIITIVGVSSFS